MKLYVPHSTNRVIFSTIVYPDWSSDRSPATPVKHSKGASAAWLELAKLLCLSWLAQLTKEIIPDPASVSRWTDIKEMRWTREFLDSQQKRVYSFRSKAPVAASIAMPFWSHPTGLIPGPPEPRNASNGPAFFTEAHNLWIEQKCSWPTGSVRTIYMESDPMIRLAKRLLPNIPELQNPPPRDFCRAWFTPEQNAYFEGVLEETEGYIVRLYQSCASLIQQAKTDIRCARDVAPPEYEDTEPLPLYRPRTPPPARPEPARRRDTPPPAVRPRSPTDQELIDLVHDAAVALEYLDRRHRMPQRHASVEATRANRDHGGLITPPRTGYRLRRVVSHNGSPDRWIRRYSDESEE